MIPSDPVARILVGVFFIILGSLVILFRDAFRDHVDSWNARMPAWLQHWPTGSWMTGYAVVAGTASVIMGIANLVSAILHFR